MPDKTRRLRRRCEETVWRRLAMPQSVKVERARACGADADRAIGGRWYCAPHARIRLARAGQARERRTA